MSGVEAAGFVLASIPLAISVLEHYQDSAKLLRTWWKIRTEYRKCVHDLTFHKHEFEGNLSELLLPMIAEEEKLGELLADPGGPCWSDAKLEEALRERMPKRYESYLETIGMMKETMERLHEAMGMDMVQLQARVVGNSKPAAEARTIFGHIAQYGEETMKWHVQRLNWTVVKKNSRAELFAEFANYNNQLSQILGSSDRISELSRTRAPKANAIDKRLWKFWNHGEILYDLLLKAWSCGCRPFHHANLLLEHRATSTISFRVVFWFQAHLTERHQPWTWQATQIRLLEEPIVPAVTTIKVPVPVLTNGYRTESATSLSSPLSRQISAPQLENFRRRDILPRFRSKTSRSILKSSKSEVITGQTVVREDESCPPAKTKVAFTETMIPQVDTAKTNNSKVEPPTNPLITNLCEKIASCSTNLTQYGCLEGGTNKFLVTPLSKADNDPQKHVTLKSLLSSTSEIRLTRQERFQIALILTSSYIQLHPTPWLTSKWSENDIFFFYDQDDHTKVRTSQPYISRALSNQLQEKKNYVAMNIPCTSTNEFRDSIRSLGIMLLELCFGKSIEEHPLWKKLSPTDEKSLELANFMVATAWCDQELQGEAGHGYKNAVHCCLHSFSDGTTGVGEKEDQWREEMFVKVVEPVKKCHESLSV